MSIDRVALAGAWLDARWTSATLRCRSDLQRRQDLLWRRFQPTMRRTPALAHSAGRPLDELPLVSPETLRRDFAAWNTLGLSLAEAEAAAEASERGEPGEARPGVAAGFSTGSSGRRGVFLSTTRERSLYLGHLLARLLPASALAQGLRVALCLRAGNRLYSDVAQAGRLRFRFFGLDLDPEVRRRALVVFDPQVLIAPSHILAQLARAVGRDPTPRPRRLFYGAESMGEAERAWIGERLGVRPDPIYQATEGFLGSACPFGVLHLNEDVLAVELKPTRAPGCYQPVVTDFRRTTQPMVRVLLDDLVEPLETPCPCGSPRRAIRGVAGRVDDLWTWGDAVITPRAVTEAVEAAIPPDARWTAIASIGRIDLEADRHVADPAVRALEALMRAHGVAVRVEPAPLATPEHPKRRRVRWRHD